MKIFKIFPISKREFEVYSDTQEKKLQKCQTEIEYLADKIELLQNTLEKTLETSDFGLKRGRKNQELAEFSLKRITRIQDLSECILKRAENIEEVSRYTLKRAARIQASEDSSLKRLKKIQMLVSENKHKYNNNYERKVVESFYEFYEKPDFQDSFLKLVTGLDSKDVEQIVKILQRQRLIKDTFNQELDIFSEEEQIRICKIKRELKQQVFCVSDCMYCYKHYFLPINHFEASVFLDKHGIECIEKIDVLRNKDIIDVGGFIGDSTLIFKPLTERQIISFEAISSNYELMKLTIQMNHLENVIPEHLALGDETGVIEMEDAGASSALCANDLVEKKGKEKVQIDTLDNYLKNKDLQIGLIKVDIEGAEQKFLKGAKKTIEKFRPILLISIYHNADDFFNIKPIIESWNLGYKFRIHKPVDYSVSREALLIAEIR